MMNSAAKKIDIVFLWFNQAKTTQFWSFQLLVAVIIINISNKICIRYTVRPLLSAVLGRTKFWSQKPRIIEVWISDVLL